MYMMKDFFTVLIQHNQFSLVRQKSVVISLPLSESGMLEQDDVSHSQTVTSSVAQQGEPTHLCDSTSSLPTSPTQAPPTLEVTEGSSPAAITEEAEKHSEREKEREGEIEQQTERKPQEVGKEGEPGGSGKGPEPGGGGMEAEPERGEAEVEPAESGPKREEEMQGGGVETVSHTEVDKGPRTQEEELEQEEEVEEAVEALELEEELQRPEDAILDDLAKRIQVEEVREKNSKSV